METNRNQVYRRNEVSAKKHSETSTNENKKEEFLPNQLSEAVNDPAASTPAQILNLQRLAGNQAVTHLLNDMTGGNGQSKPVQAKLMVGAARDKYEQEADRVVDQVLTIPASKAKSGVNLQRAAEEEEEVQTKPLSASITPLVQRAPEEEEEIQTRRLQRQEDEEEIQTLRVQRQEDEEEVQTLRIQKQEDEEEIQTQRLQRQEDEEEVQTLPVQRQEDEEEIQTQSGGTQGSFEAGLDVEEKLKSSRGNGSPLPEDLGADMEARFGADFSGVRLHTGTESGMLNRQLNAQAFTHGKDIYIGDGKYDPDGSQGRHLLAHELTHVVQQNPQVAQRTPQTISNTTSGKQPVQRLEIENTNWGAATKVTASGEGGQGVLFFDDGTKKVIVKPNIHAAEEQIASFLHAGAGGGQDGEFQVKSLPLRIATQQDILAIQAAVQRIYGTNPIPDRVSTLLGLIAPGNTMIQTMAQQGKGEGGTFGGRMEEIGGSKSGHLKRMGKGVKKESPLRVLLEEPSLMRAIGKAAAMDIFLGNTDRFAGAANFENWMMSYSKRAVYLIDNVVDKPEGQIESWKTTGGAFGGGQIQIMKANIMAWAPRPLVQMLANSMFVEIAEAIWSSDSMARSVQRAGLQSTMYSELIEGFASKGGRFVAQNQQAKIKAMVDTKLNTIKINFAAGLSAGKQSIVGLNGGKLPDNMPVSTEAKRMYRARILVMTGMEAATALRQAMQEITDWQKGRRWLPARINAQ